MQNFTRLLDSLQKPRGKAVGQLILQVIDQGPNDGIDIRIHDMGTKDLRFEIIDLIPESCTLIGQSPQSNTTFHAFCRVLKSTKGTHRIRLQIRFHDGTSSGRRMADDCSECRSRLHRMVENIADEILTHKPGAMVEIAMPEFDGMVTSLM